MRYAVWLIEQPRWFKRALLILNDIAMLTLALWAAYSLRLGEFYVPDTLGKVLLFIAAPLIGAFTFYMRGLYKLVTRFIGAEGTTRIYVAVIIAVLVWALLVLMTGVKPHPRSVVVIYGIIAAGLIRLTRQWAGAWLLSGAPEHKPATFTERKNVIIYGAGNMGVQLLRAMSETGQHQVVAFIDNNPSLAGQLVHGVKVLRPGKIGKVIAIENVKEVLLAMPSALRSERRAAIRRLEEFPVLVKTLPALEEIAAGRVEVSDLRPIEVEDLLGRDPVAPDLDLLSAHVKDKVVMITGAGGSIGSELSRQLLDLGPKTLILFELSEAALYEIEMEMDDRKRQLANEAGVSTISDTKVVSVLGSVLDRRLLSRTIRNHGVEVIYHAAAYKHVPIVEENPFAGVQNNTFGTLALAETAKELGVERIVLVSSDKAVRPTNVMGASKRLAELILQALGGASAVDDLHHGPLRQRARFLRLRRAAFPQPDPGRRTGDRHPSGDHPLFHVDPRSRPARHSGRRHGGRRRSVRARHGHAGEDRRSRPHHDPPFRPRSSATSATPTAISPSNMSASGAEKSSMRSFSSARTPPAPATRASSRTRNRPSRMPSSRRHLNVSMTRSAARTRRSCRRRCAPRSRDMRRANPVRSRP